MLNFTALNSFHKIISYRGLLICQTNKTPGNLPSKATWLKFCPNCNSKSTHLAHKMRHPVSTLITLSPHTFFTLLNHPKRKLKKTFRSLRKTKLFSILVLAVKPFSPYYQKITISIFYSPFFSPAMGTL